MAQQGIGLFTAIIIDGSKERFQPDLVTAGYDGGQRAALMLKEGAHRYLQQRGLLNQLTSPNPTHILIYVYADVQELGRFYAQQMGMTTDPLNMSSFVSGFDACPLNGGAIFGDVDMVTFRREHGLQWLFNLLASDRRCLDIIVARSMRGEAIQAWYRSENAMAIVAKLRYASFPDVFVAAQHDQAVPLYLMERFRPM